MPLVGGRYGEAMSRRWSWVVCATVVLLLVPGCRRQDNTIPEVEEQDRIVQTATLVDDETLRLTWDAAPCETFDRVEVEIDDDFVNLLIKVTVDVETCPPGGFTQTTVELGEPIGDRQIFDRAFNDTVLLETP